MNPIALEQAHFGTNPDAIAIADMDDDGVPDFIVASHAGGSVTIGWSLAGQLATTWSMGSEIGGLAVADFDGDGQRDVAVTLPRSGTVGVRSGKGGRSLSAMHSVPVGEEVSLVVAADLDGVPPAELVTVAEGRSVVVLRGFVASQAIDLGTEIRELVTGDWNGDGKTDVALALPDGSALQVLLGDGRGGLSIGPSFTVGPAPLAIVAEDLDSDGLIDLASANALDDTVTVLHGDGAGGVRERTTVATGPEPRELAVVREGDISRTLYVIGGASSRVERVTLQGGSPLVGAPPSRANTLAVGDRDGDGREELYYAAPDRGEVGTMVPGVGLALEELWTQVAVAMALPIDLDSDGRDEVAVVPEPMLGSEGKLQLFQGNGQLIDEIPLNDGGTDLLGVHAADLTLDGRPDIVAWSSTMLWSFTSDAEGKFHSSPPFPAGGNISEAHLADADGDGDLELVIAGYTVGKHGIESRISGVDFSATGAPGFVFQHAIDGTAVSMIPWKSNVGTLDLLYLESGIPAWIDDLPANGTSRWLNGAGFEPARSIIRGEGTDVLLCGAFGVLRVEDVLATESHIPERVSYAPCDALWLADMDGDETSDLLIGRGVKVNGGFRIFLTPWIAEEGDYTAMGSDGLVVDGFRSVWRAELDEDSQPEFLSVNNGTLHVLGAALGPALVDVPVYSGPQAFTLVDLNRDGHQDVLATGAAIGIALGDGAGGFGALQHQDIGELIPNADRARAAVVADFEGDGSTEVVLVVRPRDAWRSELIEVTSDARGVLQAERLSTVPVGDLVVLPADLDGDRHLDMLGLSGFGELRTLHITGLRERDLQASTWAMHPDLSMGSASFQLADLERRGILDLVAVSASLGVVVKPGHGDGNFLESHVWSPLRRLQSVSFDDLDGDGHVELLGVVGEHLVLVQGPNMASRDSYPALLRGVRAVTSFDLNGDGSPEIVAAGPSAETDGEALLHIGMSTAEWGIRFTSFNLPIPVPTNVEVRDVDGDNEPEVVLRGAGHISILRVGGP